MQHELLFLLVVLRRALLEVLLASAACAHSALARLVAHVLVLARITGNRNGGQLLIVVDELAASLRQHAVLVAEAPRLPLFRHAAGAHACQCIAGKVVHVGIAWHRTRAAHAALRERLEAPQLARVGLGAADLIADL